MKIARILFVLVWMGSMATGTNQAGDIHFVPFDKVELTDGLWKQRYETNHRVTIGHCLDKCVEVGMVKNFARAAGLEGGEYIGLPNWDEFLYKAIEAACYALVREYDATLDRQLDEIIAVIAAAQEPDGYLRTYKTLTLKKNPQAPPRWANLRDDLELYCAGHLFETAVAHYQATGKKTLLRVALKNADLIDSLFGPGRNMGVPGHEEIELALVRLYEATGEKRYLELSQFFIDQRGNARGHQPYGSFSQDHQPVRQQAEAMGQAPRATYLYSGMADVDFHMKTDIYGPALKRLWENVVFKKMYITGGIGSKHNNEGFGPAYELPNKTAYSEVCAAICFPMWNQRMFKLEPDGKFFDLIELSLYNNFLAGVSLSGDRYFYACPPESDGRYKFNLGWCPDGFDVPYSEPSATRKEWFPCACCPPNVARYMMLFPGWVYAVRDRDLYVNLYMANRAEMAIGDQTVRLVQETRYPWDGRVTFRVDIEKTLAFTLKLRIPGWSQGRPVPGDLYRYQDASTPDLTVRRNSRECAVEIQKGYAAIAATWQSGDTVELDLPMWIRRVLCHPQVKSNVGKVALQRGPIVYCAEGVDHTGAVRDLWVPDDLHLNAEYRSDLLGGVAVLKGDMAHRSPFNASSILMIPYCVWSNRGPGEMQVWFRRNREN